jgi:alginate O-acetyltransferase complex protein AlgI
LIFTSFEFVIFLGAVMVLRGVWRTFEGEKRFLLVAAYVFYMSWNVLAGGLILFSSVVDYLVGSAIGRTARPKRRKALLATSIVVNIGLLSFFKYTNFLADNLQAVLGLLGFTVDLGGYDILLPVGISFFTFQSMSYTIDVYRGKLEPCHEPRDFLLYVSFFPQLVAGPIVRASEFLPQLARRVRASWVDMEIGLAIFGRGAIKKMVISDQISPHVDVIFANPASFDALTLTQGVLGYSLQIYCDFSGYSDMAIGSARMMGFRFPDNFAMPYSAVTITEFWRRWHISLSSWLRDYLYIPLGGTRRGTVRTYVNVMATMLLGGLWHGASWNFVLWGGLHGGALAAHKAWGSVGQERKRSAEDRRLWAWILLMASRLATLAVVLVGWIFFRAQSTEDAWAMLTRIMLGAPGTSMLSHTILPALVAVTFVHVLVGKDRRWVEGLPNASVGLRICVYSGMLLLLVSLAATNTAPFIYFQF